jgi:hypothetical protein
MTACICAILLFSAIACAERCDPPAQIVEFVRTLPDHRDEQHASIARRLEASPDDFWLNRLFLESAAFNHSAVREKYRDKYTAHPDSLDDEYLYARSLVRSDTKEALRIYASILEKDPDYPWVHFSQLEIYRSPRFLDRAKVRENIRLAHSGLPGVGRAVSIFDGFG